MSSFKQLKPDIRHNIATYTLNGACTDAVVNELIRRIDSHLHILRGMHIQGLLLSFQGIPSIDEDVLVHLIKKFAYFHVKLRSMVGFCDYSLKIYPTLRKLIKKTPLGLYENLEIMALAIGSSNMSRGSAILVYADNAQERQTIASTLISNDYFALLSISKNDFKKKALQCDNYERYITKSTFSNMDKDVVITFDRTIFNYSFQGALDKNIQHHVSIENFKYRLSQGYRVIIFDFTSIFNMNVVAAKFIVELAQIAQEYNALVCCIELGNQKIDSYAISVLEKSSIWIFDDYEHVYNDEEVIQLITGREPNYSTGISKRNLEFLPYFIGSSLQTLKIYEITSRDKNPSKQIKAKDLYRIKYDIVTHILLNGDYELELIFLFTEKSSKVITQHILADYDDYEEEDYKDAMNEFVNSVTGKLKSNLRKKNMCVQFNLPKSTTRLNDIIPKSLAQSFILTRFECNDANYYVALSSWIDI